MVFGKHLIIDGDNCQGDITNRELYLWGYSLFSIIIIDLLYGFWKAFNYRC